jgi:mRNA interferase MazF
LYTHRVPIAGRGKESGFAITEQVRTVARTRFVGHRPAWVLTDDEIDEARTVLARMLDLTGD